jgi:16S rRNA U516 pseudouridylate synthase RsuA-like enzyme
MFDLIGHSVVKLKRVRIGFLYDERMRPGEWRRLTANEVQRFTKGQRSKIAAKAASSRAK